MFCGKQPWGTRPSYTWKESKKWKKWEIAPAGVENASEMLHRTHFFPSKRVKICSLWDRASSSVVIVLSLPLRCSDYTSYKYCMSKRQRSGFKWWNSLHKPATTFRQLRLSFPPPAVVGSDSPFEQNVRDIKRTEWDVPLKFTAARAFKHFRDWEKGTHPVRFTPSLWI